MSQDIYIMTKKREFQVDFRNIARNNEILYSDTFCFKAGRSYGILCEEGEGGGALSLLLSGRAKIMDEKVSVFGHEYEKGQTVSEGWFMGEGFPGLNQSAKKDIELALKESHSTLSLQDVIQEFSLSEDRLGLSIKKYSGECWRASAAIGYAGKKRIFCFPWMDTAFLERCLFTAYFYYVDKLKERGCTIIIPGPSRKILEGMTDEIIELKNPEYKDINKLMQYISMSNK